MAVIALLLMLGVPLVAGAVLLVAGPSLRAGVVRPVGLGIAALVAVLAVVVSLRRPGVDRPWLPEVGLRIHLAVDGISIPLILLTALVGVLVVALALADPVGAGGVQDAGGQEGAPGGLETAGTLGSLVGALLLIEGGALATFVARDALLFFVAFEVVLVPMWLVIRRFGDAHDLRARREAGHRFLLYTLVGSSLMLVGLLLLTTSAGTSDLDALADAGGQLPPGRQLTIALLLVLGLAVKVPVFPLHTWLPTAHTTAPTVGSVLLAAILLKMGTYGLVRLPIALVPGGFAVVAPWLAIAGVVGILWASLVCLVERDLKRLIAYSSVAHMGFVVLGLSSGTDLGLQAALYGNLAHGVISALLFVVVGGVKATWGSVDLGRTWPALREVAPRRGFFLVLGLAAALGLPGLAGFWGEFLAILAAWQPAQATQIPVFRTTAVLAAVGGVLAAAYALRVARLLWVGDAVGAAPPLAEASTPLQSPRPAGDGKVETHGVERLVLVILATAVFVLGLAPWLALDVMAPAVAQVLGGAR